MADSSPTRPTLIFNRKSGRTAILPKLIWGLSVRQSDGADIPHSGQIKILDYSEELEEIQIEVMGIPHLLYKELFPEGSLEVRLSETSTIHSKLPTYPIPGTIEPSPMPV